MSGGFTPNLVETQDPLSGQINILASQHGLMVKRGGVTLDSTKWTADANGNKLALNGHLISKITATEKYGPYDPTKSNGQENPDEILIIFNGGVNLKNGDVITGALLGGSVLEARLSGLDSAARTALKTRIIFQ
jgi:hypothetical protein